MEKFYLGNDNILYFLVNEEYYPIACSSSNSFEENSDEIDTTTRDNSGWKTSRPTNQGYSISFEGIETVNDNITGKVTYKDLENFKRNKVLISYRLGDDKIREGQAYIVQLSRESPANELVSFSGILRGFGQYTEFDPSENNVFNYDLNFDII